MSGTGRRGRRKKELVPDGGPVTALALALRELRARAGDPPYRVMAEQAHVAHNLLSQADAGHRLPTEEALVAYVTACGGNVDEWKQRLHEARAVQAGGRAPDLAAVGHALPEPRADADGANRTTGQEALAKPQDPDGRPSVMADVPVPAGWWLAKRRLVLAGIAAITALVTTATVGWLASPADDATATGTAPSAPAPSLPYVSHETFGPALPQRCRHAWTPSAVADVQFLPCIAQQPDGLIISVQLKNTGGAAAEVTAWIWLMKIDQDLLAARRYDLTRDLSTLRYCRFRLNRANEVKTCGPFKVEPPAERAWYATASSGHFLHADRPPGWDSTGFAGTQSPMVHFGQKP